MNTHDPSRYPTNEHYPLMREAINEVLNNTGVPEPLVGMAASIAQTIACQGLVAYRNPATGLVCPVSQFYLLILDSSEWRSTVDSYFMQAVYEHDRRAGLLYKAAKVAYDLDHAVWKTTDKRIRERRPKDASDVAEKEEQQRAHLLTEPTPPRLRQYLLQDASKHAIYEALAGDGESVAFVTDEADIIYDSGVMEAEGFSNKLFDGDKPLPWRRKDEFFYCLNPKVTISIMAHPVTFHNRRKKRGKQSRGTGHDARYLVAAPPSKKGTRSVRGLPAERPALNAFTQRMETLLAERDLKVQSGETGVQVLEFSDAAKETWFRQAEWIESQLSPIGFFCDTAEFGSKYMDLAGRTAAKLHYFEGLEGLISAETLGRAIRIVWFHACEFRRFFSEELKAEELRRKASNLKAFLHRHYWLGPGQPNEVSKNAVLQRFHPKDVAELDQLLDILVDEGAVSLAKGKPTKINLITPAFIQAVGPIHGIFYN